MSRFGTNNRGQTIAKCLHVFGCFEAIPDHQLQFLSNEIRLWRSLGLCLSELDYLNEVTLGLFPHGALHKGPCDCHGTTPWGIHLINWLLQAEDSLNLAGPNCLILFSIIS